MSGIDTKKPEKREELIKIVAEAIKKERDIKASQRNRPRKPTISGTAKTLNIHRDTLYTWLKEFNVDFKQISDDIPTNLNSNVGISESTFLIGEALVGEGTEVAHIDLLMGDKNGPIGKAFATGLSNL
jgi:hypothetical protein